MECGEYSYIMDNLWSQKMNQQGSTNQIKKWFSDIQTKNISKGLHSLLCDLLHSPSLNQKTFFSSLLLFFKWATKPLTLLLPFLPLPPKKNPPFFFLSLPFFKPNSLWFSLFSSFFSPQSHQPLKQIIMAFYSQRIPLFHGCQQE